MSEKQIFVKGLSAGSDYAFQRDAGEFFEGPGGFIEELRDDGNKTRSRIDDRDVELPGNTVTKSLAPSFGKDKAPVAITNESHS